MFSDNDLQFISKLYAIKERNNECYTKISHKAQELITTLYNYYQLAENKIVVKVPIGCTPDSYMTIHYTCDIMYRKTTDSEYSRYDPDMQELARSAGVKNFYVFSDFSRDDFQNKLRCQAFEMPDFSNNTNGEILNSILSLASVHNNNTILDQVNVSISDPTMYFASRDNDKLTVLDALFDITMNILYEIFSEPENNIKSRNCRTDIPDIDKDIINNSTGAVKVAVPDLHINASYDISDDIENNLTELDSRTIKEDITRNVVFECNKLHQKLFISAGGEWSEHEPINNDDAQYLLSKEPEEIYYIARFYRLVHAYVIASKKTLLPVEVGTIYGNNSFMHNALVEETIKKFIKDGKLTPVDIDKIISIYEKGESGEFETNYKLVVKDNKPANASRGFMDELTPVRIGQAKQVHPASEDTYILHVWDAPSDFA